MCSSSKTQSSNPQIKHNTTSPSPVCLVWPSWCGIHLLMLVSVGSPCGNASTQLSTIWNAHHHWSSSWPTAQLQIANDNIESSVPSPVIAAEIRAYTSFLAPNSMNEVAKSIIQPYWIIIKFIKGFDELLLTYSKGRAAPALWWKNTSRAVK